MKIALQQVQQNIADIANRHEYTADIIYELLGAYGRSKSAITQLREGHLNKVEDAGAVLQKDVVYFRTFAPGTPLEAEVEDLSIGNYYIHDGQMLRIVDETEKKRVYDRNKERFRVIYENGTESNMYRRSLSQRLREDVYTVVGADYIPVAEDDTTAGHIYVLASLSQDPKITTIANLHKIGVTTGSVANRVKNAATDPTYLMAPVKMIEDYRLTGDYNPQKVEDLIHQIFGHAKVDLQIVASDGSLYTPQEWYSVPLGAILEAVELIATGEIVNYHYDSATQSIVEN
ncbi:MAG: GIY-YIG nuclease family protein [Candidatus Nanoperiomorbaceae bacterium]